MYFQVVWMQYRSAIVNNRKDTHCICCLNSSEFVLFFFLCFSMLKINSTLWIERWIVIYSLRPLLALSRLSIFFSVNSIGLFIFHSGYGIVSNCWPLKLYLIALVRLQCKSSYKARRWIRFICSTCRQLFEHHLLR